ncbi:MAG: hypothetical protein KGQ52_03025 [Alphaproteobacteria bacterium]|nr:hypothetical protein [Alphaproteobacteria bacterium]
MGDACPPLRLALIGVPAALAEPVAMLAEIMGWQVIRLPAGPVMRPAARLCLAMLPGPAGDFAPLAAWSPDAKLNEHISAAGLSIMDHPPCLSGLELLLGLASSQASGGGVADDAFQGDGQEWRAHGGPVAAIAPGRWRGGA